MATPSSTSRGQVHRPGHGNEKRLDNYIPWLILLERERTSHLYLSEFKPVPGKALLGITCLSPGILNSSAGRLLLILVPPAPGQCSGM